MADVPFVNSPGDFAYHPPSAEGVAQPAFRRVVLGRPPSQSNYQPEPMPKQED
jgi:hypothetical protein